jgi:hypothetical protein
MKYLFAFWGSVFLIACHHHNMIERTAFFPRQVEMHGAVSNAQKTWIFIMAGQSNMAGRGLVEPKDTLVNKRILTIDSEGHLIIAKEPLHWYEPSRTGLDCGYSFGKTMIRQLPSDISVLIIPTAIGGSSISQWIGDSLYRDVKLLSNFIEKVQMAKQYGIVKGILWHQGESDANEVDIPNYKERLRILFAKFRSTVGYDSLPVLLGELGRFSKDKEHFASINRVIHDYSSWDKNTAVIFTGDLKDKGDSLHFDSKSQRMMGKRFAEMYWKKFGTGE